MKKIYIFFNTFLFLLDKKLKIYNCIKFYYLLYGFMLTISYIIIIHYTL